MDGPVVTCTHYRTAVWAKRDGAESGYGGSAIQKDLRIFHRGPMSLKTVEQITGVGIPYLDRKVTPTGCQ